MVRAESVPGKPPPNGKPKPDEHLAPEPSAHGQLDDQFAGRAKEADQLRPGGVLRGGGRRENMEPGKDVPITRRRQPAAESKQRRAKGNTRHEIIHAQQKRAGPYWKYGDRPGVANIMSQLHSARPRPKVNTHPDAKAHANGKPSPDGRPKPDDRLTPEESARKFDILEGIRAIPVEDMPGCLKPLAQSWMSHAGYGQGVSYASYDTLGRETGCRGRYVRDLARKLLEAEWFVSRGRRDGQSKHCRPEIAPGPRMVVYLRSYFAEVDGRYVNPVDGRYVNKPVGSSGPKNRDDQPPGRPDVRVETAPSVPVGEKSGGKGPPPLSPSTSTDGENLAAHDPLYLRRTIVEGWVRDALTKFAGDLERARIALMSKHGNDPVNRRLIEAEIAKRKEA